MRIKAAFFRVQGVQRPTDAITDQVRSAAWRLATSRFLPPNTRANQHDLTLWSQLLADEMRPRRPASTVAFRTDIVRNAAAAYKTWGESLRYRAVQPTRAEWQRVSALATWFAGNDNRMT